MTDCFAKDERKCMALQIKECKNCTFYKTPEKAAADRMAALKRISELPVRKYLYIRDKYFIDGTERTTLDKLRRIK